MTEMNYTELNYTVTEAAYDLTSMSNPYARITDLAARLGVAQRDHKSSPASVLVSGRDGDTYDLFDVIDALLDRIDKVTALTS